MKFFIDTEFLEGKQDKKIFGIKYGETKPTIDLISIGVVDEKGREYYEVSKDFNLKEAWNRCDIVEGEKIYWIRENILRPILTKWNPWLKFNYKCFKQQLEVRGKTNKEIAAEVEQLIQKDDRDIEFYTYYGAYDHVVFCWLFGKMIDLPKRFPMYTNDLRHMLVEKAKIYKNSWMRGDENIRARLVHIRQEDEYPIQPKNHIAIEDARWNKRLYEFINTLD